MKDFFSKKIYYETVAQWMFRFLVIAVVVTYFAMISILPVENDETFEVNLVKKYDTEITEEDVLFTGEFELLKADGVTEPISLPAKIPVKVGEKAYIKSYLPDDYNQDYIVVRSSQEDMTIFIDGKARVIYNTESTRPVGTQTTSRYVFCRTSAADAGKELKICVSSNNEGYSVRFNEVYACDRFIFWKYILNQSIFNVILGILSIGIGLFVIILGISLSKIIKISFGLENAGWCISFVGMWIMAESKIRQLLSPNASVLSNIAFIVIMLGPIPLLMYVNYLQERRYSVVYKALITLAYINTFCQFILQLISVSNFLDMLYFSHIILFASIVVTIALMIADAKKGLIGQYRNICIGLIILLAFVFIEMVSVYFVPMASGVFAMIGVGVFTVFALADTAERYKKYERNRQAEKLRVQKEHSDSMTMQMIKTLSDTLEAKDEYTNGHSFRVAEYSSLIAEKMGMSAKEISELRYAASLHDIGKIGVPDTILNKPSRLTNDEYEIIKTHTTIGADIVRGIELIAYAEDIVRHHHERYDGKGYPAGLAGEEIPFLARIVAVADSYDAMNSKRIYRKNLPDEVIREEIIKNKGLQFDPDIADVFIELLDEGKLNIAYEEEQPNESLLEEVDIENVAEAGQMFSALMERIKSSAEANTIDFLTGLMLRKKGASVISSKMETHKGALIFIDLDNLKVVNDIHGHKTGDEALTIVGEIIGKEDEKITAFRAGGDEFVVFYEDANENDALDYVKNVMSDYQNAIDKDSRLSTTSISMGIYMVSADDKFEDAMNKADKALYYVKKSGKKGYSFYKDEENHEQKNDGQVDLDNLITAIKTSGTYTGSLNIEYREFTKLYEYIVKVCRRYEHTCHLVLVTIKSELENTSTDDYEQAMESMGIAIRENIRNVDVCTRYSSIQYLVILLEAGDENIDLIMQRIFSRYYKICNNHWCIPTYQSSSMKDK